MFSKEERKLRRNLLEKVIEHASNASKHLAVYEQKFGRDGYIISVKELLDGAIDSLASSIQALALSEADAMGVPVAPGMDEPGGQLADQQAPQARPRPPRGARMPVFADGVEAADHDARLNWNFMQEAPIRQVPRRGPDEE